MHINKFTKLSCLLTMVSNYLRLRSTLTTRLAVPEINIYMYYTVTITLASGSGLLNLNRYIIINQKPRIEVHVADVPISVPVPHMLPRYYGIYKESHTLTFL